MGKERERNINVREKDRLLLVHTRTEDQTCNPGMCPDKESNQRNFTQWNDSQPSEPHRSGLVHILIIFLEGRKLIFLALPLSLVHTHHITGSWKIFVE